MRRGLLVVGFLALLMLAVAAGWWIRGSSQVLPTPSIAAQASTAPRRAGLPDPELTPGAVNTAVSDATLDATICKPGWTATVRPPSAYTSGLKLAQIVQYGYDDKNPRDYEEDHLVPLELGGAPRDPRNLWPQPMTAALPDGTSIGADEKDDLEDELKSRVCARTLDLGGAQRAIAGDWIQTWLDEGEP